MFFSRNKTCIIRLAAKNFKSSKIRNGIAILAIVLTTVLFTSMTTICTGTYQYVQTTMQMQKGSKADGDIRYLSKEQFELLSQNENIKINGCRRPIGFATNSVNHNVEIDYMDETEQELTFNNPTHGEAPQKSNEIATTDRALKSLGVEPKVGEKVELEFKLRDTIYTYDMVVSGWWEASNSQVSVLLVSEEFMAENESLFPYTFDKDQEYAGTFFSDIVFRSKDNVNAQIDALVEEFNKELGTDVIAGAVNTVTNPSIDFSILFVVLIFVLLFIFTGYLLINNIFSISIMQDVRRYGLLKTIGLTQRQISLLVTVQAIWLVLIAMPIGLLIGYLLGKAILPIAIEIIVNEHLIAPIEVRVTPLIFIVAVIFTIVTVGISIKKPIRIIKRISPLAAIHFIEGKNNRKKKKTKRISIAKMAIDNFRRNLKRSIFIVISITLCCILFNSILIIANSISVEKAIKAQSAVDFEIGSANLFNSMNGFTRHSDGLDIALIDEIEKTFPVKESGIIYKNTLDDAEVTYDYGSTIDGEIRTEELVDIEVQNGKRIVLGDNGLPICNVYGIDENVYNRISIQVSLDDINSVLLFDDFEQKNLIIEAVRAPRGSEKPDEFQCEIGDKVKVFVDGDMYEYTVAAHAYVSPTEYEAPNITTGTTAVGGDGPMFYLSQSNFIKLYDQPTIMNYTFNVEEGKISEVSAEMDEFVEIQNGKIGFSSSEILKDSMESIKNIIYAIGIVISSIIGVSGFINFTNLTITNILNRRKEFAVMESIGMTKKQLKLLATAEGLIHAVLSSILSVLFSVVIGFALLLPISEKIWFMEFHMQIAPAVLLSAFTIILTLILPILLLKVFNKGSIMEKLRLEN